MSTAYRARAIVLIAVILLCAAPPQASSHWDLHGNVKSSRTWPNPFANVDVPSADELWHTSQEQNRLRNPKELTDFTAWDCTKLLMGLKTAFPLARPNAPNPVKDVHVDVSWNFHVEMKKFRNIYWCSLKGKLKKALDKIDQQTEKPIPMPYRPPPQGYDYDAIRNWPSAFRRIRHFLGDLAILSTRGFAPAMVTFAKLSERGDVIRLTPRFTFFLLQSAQRDIKLDPRRQAQLDAAREALTADERAEIKRRVEAKDWPLEESMVLDQ